MKTIILFSAFLFSTLVSNGQTINPNYNSTLAFTLGADDNGMKMYVFIILKTGNNTSENKAATDSLFTAT